MIPVKTETHPIPQPRKCLGKRSERGRIARDPMFRGACYVSVLLEDAFIGMLACCHLRLPVGKVSCDPSLSRIA
eukprot:s2092_g10.t1